MFWAYINKLYIFAYIIVFNSKLDMKKVYTHLI